MEASDGLRRIGLKCPEVAACADASLEVQVGDWVIDGCPGKVAGVDVQCPDRLVQFCSAVLRWSRYPWGDVVLKTRLSARCVGWDWRSVVGQVAFSAQISAFEAPSRQTLGIWRTRSLARAGFRPDS